jgi:hypothetical protein
MTHLVSTRDVFGIDTDLRVPALCIVPSLCWAHRRGPYGGF